MELHLIRKIQHIILPLLTSLLMFIAVEIGLTPHVSASSTWVSQTSNTTNDFYGIGYGNGQFVGVGLSNMSDSSPDGSSWTSNYKLGVPAHIGIADGLGVIYQGGTWISVSDDGNIYTSTDNGANWQSAYSSSSGMQISALASNGSTIVAVGQNDSVFVKLGNNPWSKTSPMGGSGTDLMNSVTYGGDNFIAVGNNNTIFLSQDGVSWQKQTPPAGVNTDFFGVTYAKNQFIAVGMGGVIITSPDGSSWTKQTSGTTYDLYGVAYGLGKIAAVGDHGTILVSTDGISWSTENSNTQNRFYNITYGANYFVAVGAGGMVMTELVASTNANLSSLAINPGTLSTTFSSGTTSYTASVPNSTTSINVTPTVADSTATVTVNGTPVTSGSASPVSLNVGSNTIKIEVTAQDGITKQTYTVNVSRAKSSNADLSNLTLSAGTLNPSFATGTTSYTTSVANDVSSVEVTPTEADSTATVTVNGNPATNGQASNVSLSVGDNPITVLVTAQDGSTKTYTVTVTRAPAPLSSNADLSNLALSPGTLDPVFASGTTSYTTSVVNDVSSVEVTPTVADSTATVKVNGLAVTSGITTSVNLNVGSNTVVVDVTAEDGSVKTYTVTVTRAAAPLSSNADLSNLTVSSGTLNPSFSSGTTSYTASVANGVTSVDVTPTVAESHATVTINGTAVVNGNASIIALNVGSNTITIVVTAQGGSNKIYSINVTRAAAPLSHNADLSNLTLSAVTLNPSFITGTTSYTASVPNDVSSVNVTPTVADSTATMTVNGNVVPANGNAYTVPLNVGNNTITVAVTAQDGTTTKTYTIAVDRAAALSSNADYTMTTGLAIVPYTVTSEDITVTPSDNTASVTINGQPVTNGQATTVNLSVGVNTFTIVVTAQDGITKKTGQVNITRQTPSTNAELNSLSVDTGTLNPSFSPSNMDYSVDVPNTTASVAITPTLADGTGKIVVDGNPATSGQSSSITLSNTTTTVPIVITAQDGTTTKTYTITINKAMNDTEAVEADKSTLSIGYASGDSASSVTQNVTLPTSGANGTTIVWTSTDSAIAADGKVTRPSYNAGDKTVTLTATLTKGTAGAVQPFTLTVRKESSSSNTALSTLSLSSGITLNETVSSSVYAYTANIGNTVTSTTISAIPVDGNASVSYKLNGNPVNNPIPLSVGFNVITVEITAQDGVTKQDYTVSLNRDASGNADLSNIRINGNLLSNFNPTVTEYAYQVPNNVTDVTVIGSTDDPTATVQVTGGHGLNVGSNPVTLVVTAQNHTAKQYVVNIVRTGSSNTQLSSLRTNVGELTPTFNGTAYLYTLNQSLPNNVDTLSVTASVYDPTATIQVNGTPLISGQTSGPIVLQVGNNDIQIVVTAQDGTKGNYLITANRAAALSGLTVNQGTLSPTFDPGTLTYRVEVPYVTYTLSVNASVYDPNCTITINGVPTNSGTNSSPISLQVGNNTIPVVVTAHDGVTTQTYTLNVTRDGNITGGSSGGSSSSYRSPIAVTITNSDGKTGTIPPGILKMLRAEQASITVLNTDGTSGPSLSISPDGQVHLQGNVGAGSYPVTIHVIAPNGEGLATISGTLTVDSNGASRLSLIDPYGVITDSVTKKPISGVNVQLYWADTDFNRSKGRTPDTVVTLPALPNFDPNKNQNPQISTTDGRYGWMVFPDGDYYVIAKKDGYQTYDSRKDTRDEQQGDTSYIRDGLIHVGKTIVHMDFSMSQNQVIDEGSQQEGYIKGYPDGTFRPENQVTRAELASILARVLPMSAIETKNAFSDVSSTHWAIQPIKEIAGNQVMGGYPDGTFHPDSPITRAEMASIVARVKHLDTKTPATFKDTTNHWASTSIGAVQTAGLISGYPDGAFHPDQPLTRAEAVTIVNRMIGKTGSQHPSQASWKDVPSTYWAYDQIVAASR